MFTSIITVTSRTAILVTSTWLKVVPQTNWNEPSIRNDQRRRVSSVGFAFTFCSRMEPNFYLTFCSSKGREKMKKFSAVSTSSYYSFDSDSEEDSANEEMPKEKQKVVEMKFSGNR